MGSLLRLVRGVAADPSMPVAPGDSRTGFWGR
jgi:hypothetical protein